MAAYKFKYDFLQFLGKNLYIIMIFKIIKEDLYF